MEYPNRKIWIVQCLLLFSAACFISQLNASDDVVWSRLFVLDLLLMIEFVLMLCGWCVADFLRVV